MADQQFTWGTRRYDDLNAVVICCEAIECSIEIWPRPFYCDRGKWEVHVLDEGFPTNPNPFDGSDMFPRLFFDLDRAKAEMEDLLKCRKYHPKETT